MNWIELVESEKRSSLLSKNPGIKRVAARRMVLVAVKELQKNSIISQNINSAIVALEVMASKYNSEKKVAEAANRLLTRLDKNFNSPSTSPIEDAEIIVEFIKIILLQKQKFQ